MTFKAPFQTKSGCESVTQAPRRSPLRLSPQTTPAPRRGRKQLFVRQPSHGTSGVLLPAPPPAPPRGRRPHCPGGFLSPRPLLPVSFSFPRPEGCFVFGRDCPAPEKVAAAAAQRPWRSPIKPCRLCAPAAAAWSRATSAGACWAAPRRSSWRWCCEMRSGSR